MLFNVGLTFSPAAIMALDRMAIYSLEVVQRKRYSIMSKDGIIKPCLFVCLLAPGKWLLKKNYVQWSTSQRRSSHALSKFQLRLSTAETLSNRPVHRSQLSQPLNPGWKQAQVFFKAKYFFTRYKWSIFWKTVVSHKSTFDRLRWQLLFYSSIALIARHKLQWQIKTLSLSYDNKDHRPAATVQSI